MHLSVITIIAVALNRGAVSATGSLGFALGAKNSDGTCKSMSDYEADFDAILSQTVAKTVRCYAASHCETAKNILPAAKAKGFQVILGIWPETDVAYNADIEAIQQYVPQYSAQVYGIAVGSDFLKKKIFTGQQLANRMQRVNATLNGQFKVGTSESWGQIVDGTADAVIKAQPDFMLVNTYPFWQGKTINNATHTYFDNIAQAYQHIETVSAGHSIQLWTGETGWPTTGAVRQDKAVGGNAPAQKFWIEGICGMLAWGYNVFYFEAFDELGKAPNPEATEKFTDESHWGAMTLNRSSKFSLSC